MAHSLLHRSRCGAQKELDEERHHSRGELTADFRHLMVLGLRVTVDVFAATLRVEGDAHPRLTTTSAFVGLKGHMMHRESACRHVDSTQPGRPPERADARSPACRRTEDTFVFCRPGRFDGYERDFDAAYDEPRGGYSEHYPRGGSPQRYAQRYSCCVKLSVSCADTSVLFS